MLGRMNTRDQKQDNQNHKRYNREANLVLFVLIVVPSLLIVGIVFFLTGVQVFGSPRENFFLSLILLCVSSALCLAVAVLACRFQKKAPARFLLIAAFLATIGVLWLLGVHAVVGNIFTSGSWNAEEHVLYNITFGQEFVPADDTEYDTSQTYYFVTGYDSAGSKQQVPIPISTYLEYGGHGYTTLYYSSIPGIGEVVDVRFTKD